MVSFENSGFTEEQTNYLSGFVSGVLQARELPFLGQDSGGRFTHEPAAAVEESVFGTPIDDLCKKERIKHEKNGLDCYDAIMENACKNAFPEGGDVFRYKFHGLFFVSPAQESFMLRCRIAGGALSTYQFRRLAEIAADWGSGRIDLTTRSNVQIREIMPKDCLDVLMKLDDIGLTSQGSGADNIRNITATPTTGFDPDELIDVMPYARAMHHYILRDGRTDPESIANTEGIGEFTAFLRDYSPAAIAERAGLTVDDIEALARTVSEPGKRVSWWWTMGINQSFEGVRAAQAIINLALITGNIGKPGTGANSITGQCNAMGSRLFSNTTSLVAGHDFTNPEHREKVAAGLGVPIENVPTDPSLAYDQILAAAEAGTIKGLWIVATNPFHSWIDSGRFAALREKLQFLVVQDMYQSTESARAADLVLPAAGWGEKDGCFINSERRIGTLKAVRKAPGQALSDFRILRLIAKAWGCGDLFARWTDPEAAFKLLRDLTIDRPCDITGIDGYAHIDEQGGIQWPFPEASRPQASERRLFEDGVFHTLNGKARILFSPPGELPEPPDADYPFTLLTGRGTSSQWHTLSRTGKSDILGKLCPSHPYIEIHAEDAAALGLKENHIAIVQSRRGEMRASVYIAPTVRRGQLFLPMHYPEVNRLTHPSFDPHSRQPNYKACAVRIRSIAAG